MWLELQGGLDREEPSFYFLFKFFYVSSTRASCFVQSGYLLAGRFAPQSKTREQGMNQRIVSSGMLRRVALVRSDVSEELSASFIMVTRIGELETTLSVTDGC
jgi:hypothetical protein